MKNPSPLVSVVIPFFNAEHTLNRALLSISAQTLTNFECIMADNNTTDASLSIARAWAEKDSRFKWIRAEEQGVANAFNRGASIATGKYLARMDADDEAFPERLRMQCDLLEKDAGCDAVGGMVEYCSHISQSKGFKKYVDKVNAIKTPQQIFLKQFHRMPVVNPSMMWRKASADKYGLYKQGPFPEDYEMWLRWLHHKAKIAKVDGYVLRWHDYPHRITRNHRIYSEEAFLRIKTYYLAKWLEMNNPHYPHVFIWGASRQSRKCSRLLESYNIRIHTFIDIKLWRDLTKPVIHFSEIPPPGHAFILIYVQLESAQQEIVEYLGGKGYVEGRHFLVAA